MNRVVGINHLSVRVSDIKKSRAFYSKLFKFLGLHHYAFELRSRKDVDQLGAFVKKRGAKIVDPPDEYYEDYYAVFFLDPDGLKLEGMQYGEKAARQKKLQLD